MGVLQAWPGRGFWEGQAHPSAAPGTLTTMVHQMAQVSQPSLFSSWVRGFGSFDASHGWGVNLVVVLLLLVIGACFVSGNHRFVRIGVVVGAVLCLADWILVQDFGFFGGVGTDPNSMIPMAAVFTGGYLAMFRLPVRVQAPVESSGSVPVASGVPTGILDRLTPSYLLRTLAALGAVGVVLVGAAPMAVAATNPNADPILAEASNGTPNVVDIPALTNAFDRQEGLDHLANWTYLTGSVAQLDQVWSDYGVQTEVTPAGGMVAHSDIVYIIDGSGHTREILN